MERTEGEEQKTTTHSFTYYVPGTRNSKVTGQRSYFDELTRIDINSYYL